MSIFHYCKDNSPNNLNLFAKNIECSELGVSGDTVIPNSSMIALGLTNFVGLNSQSLGSKFVKRYRSFSAFTDVRIREYFVQFECVTTATTSTFSCDFKLDNSSEFIFWKKNHLDIEASNSEYQGYTFTKVNDIVTLTVDVNTTFASSAARWTFEFKTQEVL